MGKFPPSDVAAAHTLTDDEERFECAQVVHADSQNSLGNLECLIVLGGLKPWSAF